MLNDLIQPSITPLITGVSVILAYLLGYYISLNMNDIDVKVLKEEINSLNGELDLLRNAIISSQMGKKLENNKGVSKDHQVKK